MGRTPWWLALGAVVAAGCFGSNAEDASSGPAFEQEAEYLEAVARIGCARTERCVRPTLMALGSGAGDLRHDACEEAFEAQSDGTSVVGRSITAGRISYHPEHLDACLAANEGSGCVEAAAPDACLMAFDGQVAEGEPCTISYDCRDGGFCDAGLDMYGEGGHCPSTCSARVQEGEPCTFSDACVRGLVCRDPDYVPSSPQERRCLPPATEGEVCHGVHCAAGLVCSLELESGTLACHSYAQGIGEGAECGPLAQCAGDLACRASEPGGVSVCTAPVGGLACTGAASCGSDYVCACLEPNCEDGSDPLCQPWPVEGQRCVYAPSGPTGGGAMCATGRRCLPSGVCAFFARDGEACETTSECFRGRCADGHCVPPGECES